MTDPKLTDIKGIGPKTAAGLATLGIDTVGALAAAPVELIATLPGFFTSRAAAARAAAVELTTRVDPVVAAAGGDPDPDSARDAPTSALKTAKKAKKSKKKKKNKKKRGDEAADDDSKTDTKKKAKKKAKKKKSEKKAEKRKKKSKK